MRWKPVHFDLRRCLRRGIPLLLLVILLLFTVYCIAIPRTQADTVSLGDYDGQPVVDSFSFDKNTGSFSVTLTNGDRYMSNTSLESAEGDTIAKGVNRMMMLSQLMVSYANADGNVTTVSSYAGALASGKVLLDARIEGNLVTCVYNFTVDKQKGLYISIPVAYTFAGGYVECRICLDDIQDADGFQVTEISLLPYMGAADSQTDGYMLLPDGCGAVMNFNNGKGAAGEYYANIYGTNPTLKIKKQLDVTQTARLPAFAMVRGHSAMMAIITEGDALASVTAAGSGCYSDYNFAHFNFCVRESDTITFNELGWDERSLPAVSKTRATGHIAVRYYFMETENTTVAELASFQREYLKAVYHREAAGTANEDVPLFLDVQMSVSKVRPVLGLPKQTLVSLTTFDQLGSITDDLLQSDVDHLIMHLDGYQKGGPNGPVSSQLTINSAVGGTSALRRFAAAYGGDTTYFFSVDFVNAYTNGGGFLSMLQGVRDVSGAQALQYRLLASTGVKDLTSRSWNLINPGFSYSLISRFIHNSSTDSLPGFAGYSMDKYSSTVYSDSYPSVIYAITGRTVSDRQNTEELQMAAMAMADDATGSLMVKNANSYAFASADYALDVPMDSSRYQIFDETVPYYQMVLSGLLSSASTAINLEDNPEDALLTCLETGVYPLYSVYYEESSLVKNTSLNDHDTGQYALWRDFILSWYESTKPVYARIAGQEITQWTQLESGFYRTVYADGTVVYTNHTDTDREIEGMTVSAMSFAMKGGT